MGWREGGGGGGGGQSRWGPVEAGRRDNDNRTISNLQVTCQHGLVHEGTQWRVEDVDNGG